MERMPVTVLVDCKKGGFKGQFKSSYFWSNNKFKAICGVIEWCNSNIRDIKFFYVSNDEVEAQIFQQEERFKKAKKIPGIRSHHCFIPNATGEITVKRISEYCIQFFAY